MHFSQAVAIIQSQVGIIKGVQVLYSDATPLDVDIIINLPQDGIRLIFDPVVQRLKEIEVFNMKLIKLKYCALHFNSPEVAPSIGWLFIIIYCLLDDICNFHCRTN